MTRSAGGRVDLIRWRVLCLVPLLAILGCGGGGDGIGKLLPVKGQVMLGTSPLTAGTVTFHPDGSKGNTTPKPSQGKIGADGSYEVFTQGAAGAPGGWYKVTVYAAKPIPEGGDEYAPAELLVAEMYTMADKSTLAVEVKEDAAAGAYDFKVEAK